MPASKIVDEDEVMAWFRQGKTYDEMSALYLQQYGIETVPSLWANFRRRRNLPSRVQHDEHLIPWTVERQHKFHYFLRMLRLEARARREQPLRDTDEVKRRAFLNRLARENVVVAYDPATEDGFTLVPRRASDLDIVRSQAPVHVGRHAAR